MASRKSKGECSKNSRATNSERVLNNDSETCGDLDNKSLAELLKCIPEIEPNEELLDAAMEAKKLMENVISNKQSDNMDFPIDQIPQGDELDQMIETLNNKSDSMFKQLRDVQAEFDNMLNFKNMSNASKRRFMKLRREVMEKTIAFEKDTEELRNSNPCAPEKQVPKNLNDKLVDEELKKRKSSNHKHLLSVNDEISKNICDEFKNLSFGTAKGMKKMDPYTKKPILKPVINTICKHTYDPQSVETMFLNKRVISCPYTGCSNKHTTKKHLKYDE